MYLEQISSSTRFNLRHSIKIAVSKLGQTPHELRSMKRKKLELNENNKNETYVIIINIQMQSTENAENAVLDCVSVAWFWLDVTWKD